MRKKMCPLEFRIYPDSRDMARQWFVKGHDENNKPVKFRVPTAATAKQREALAKAIIEKFITEGHGVFKKKEKAVEPSNYIIAAFFDILDEKKATVRRKTYQSYLSHLRNFNDFIKAKKVKVIDDTMARLFLLHLKAKGLSHTTINAHRLTLRHFYNALIERRKNLKHNPFKSTLKLKENRIGAHYLTLKQIETYKRYVMDHKPFLWLPSIVQFYTFIRPSAELRFIQVADVDLEKRLIRIPAHIAKNGKSEFVKIPDPLYPYIADMNLHQYPENYYLIGHDATPSVKPVSYNFWSDHFRQVRTAINLPKRYVFYSFKHSGAANYIENTGDIMGLSRQMRHSTLAMTSIYLKSIGIEDLEKLKGGFSDL